MITNKKVCYDSNIYSLRMLRKSFYIAIISLTISTAIMLFLFSFDKLYRFSDAYFLLFLPIIVLAPLFAFLTYNYRYFLREILPEEILYNITCKEFVSLVRFLDLLLNDNSQILSYITYNGPDIATAIRKLESIDQTLWRGILGVLEIIGLDLDTLKKRFTESKTYAYTKFLIALFISLVAISFVWLFVIAKIRSIHNFSPYITLLSLLTLISIIPALIASFIHTRSIKKKLNLDAMRQYDFQEFVEKLIERLLALATKHSPVPIHLQLSRRYKFVKMLVIFGFQAFLIEPQTQVKIEPINVEGYIQKLKKLKNLQ